MVSNKTDQNKTNENVKIKANHPSNCPKKEAIIRKLQLIQQKSKTKEYKTKPS